MLLEPDADQSEAITAALQAAGYAVRHAHSAQEAIRHSDQAVPALVVLELSLQAHNGIEFLHEFRSYAEWTLVPVVVFSAQRLADPRQLAHFGDVTYLYKPATSLADLCRHVQATLRDRDHQQAAE